MLKEKKGLTGIDIVLTVIIVILFTSIILSLMYNVKQQNLKQVYKQASNIYLTETLENIGIADYEDIIETTSENNSELIPDLPSMFYEKIEVESIKNEENPNKEDIIKKVTVTIFYTIGNKTYETVAQRLKIKE